MKPKKKENAVLEESKLEFERLQADHEMFLQAFEKPTQIYRYIRNRTVVSPIFLQRNLSYMSERFSMVQARSQVNRRSFKIDSLLSKAEARHRKENPDYSYKTEFMNIEFLGYYDQNRPRTIDSEVQVALLKICHKKRKDVSSPVLQVDLGRVSVPVNPSDLATPSKRPAISVGSKNFNHNNGHSVKSYTLLFHVLCHVEPSSEINGLVNGDHSQEIKMEGEPSPKRCCHYSPTVTTRQASQSASPRRQCCMPPSDSSTATYGAELVVYDKYQRCLLMEGEYEIALQDLRHSAPNKKQATWETVMGGKAIGPFEVFNKCPTLKFKLGWSQLPADEPPGESDMDLSQEQENKPIVPKHFIPRLEQLEKRAREAVSPSKRKRIFYQFLYNNNTRQQTEARDDLSCPWCSLPCLDLYALLKHLRCCHPRFNFSFTEHPKGARIDVSIDMCFDGAYVGNPQDLHSHIGYAFSRNGPVRRIPVTHVMVYRPKKPLYNMVEFMEPESESHSTRQKVQGHNRLYYHTVTVQPVRACEIDSDSEDENDPLWLRHNTMKMIDEFTDVNEGEKEVMKMWNIHVMHHNYIGDCQMPTALSAFVEEYGTSVLQQNLVRNFILHVINLYDFGLVRSEVVYRTVMHLLQLRNRLEADGLLPTNNGEEITCSNGEMQWQECTEQSEEDKVSVNFSTHPSFSAITQQTITQTQEESNT